MSDLIDHGDHQYRVMCETGIDRFGLSYYFADVELRTTPAVRAYRKDFNYVSRLVATATTTQGRRGADIGALRAAIADALTQAEDTEGFVTERLQKISRRDEAPILLRHRARILHPLLVPYLHLIVVTDRALAGLNVLLAFNAIDDKTKMQSGLRLTRSLFGIKGSAMRTAN